LEAARSKCWLASIALDAARSNNCRQENSPKLDLKVSGLWNTVLLQLREF